MRGKILVFVTRALIFKVKYPVPTTLAPVLVSFLIRGVNEHESTG
jgi:hypothetical protein